MTINTLALADAYFDAYFPRKIAFRLKRNFRANLVYRLMFFDRRDAYKKTRLDSPEVSFFNFGRMLAALYYTGHYSGYMSAMMRQTATFSKSRSVLFNWTDTVDAVATNIYNS